MHGVTNRLSNCCKCTVFATAMNVQDICNGGISRRCEDGAYSCHGQAGSCVALLGGLQHR